jgi:adenylylsulfate kinase
MSHEQPGFVLWLTGLPSSGKSTLARLLCDLLREQRGLQTQLLDSDALRRVLTPDPAYTPAERDWFYDVLVFLAVLLANNGVNVVIAATGARRAYRDAARQRLPRFAEIHVHCPVDVCRRRDPKGLWQKVEEGAIARLPGADVPYEAPLNPQARIDTSQTDPQAAAQSILHQLAAARFFT